MHPMYSMLYTANLSLCDYVLFSQQLCDKNSIAITHYWDKKLWVYKIEKVGKNHLPHILFLQAWSHIGVIYVWLDMTRVLSWMLQCIVLNGSILLYTCDVCCVFLATPGTWNLLWWLWTFQLSFRIWEVMVIHGWLTTPLIFLVQVYVLLE